MGLQRILSVNCEDITGDMVPVSALAKTICLTEILKFHLLLSYSRNVWQDCKTQRNVDGNAETN